MRTHDRILNDAAVDATQHGASFGWGGMAIAKMYREEPLDGDTMLGIIAVLVNRIAELEEEIAA